MKANLKRMVTKYVQTINRFTELPNIENLISNVAKYKEVSKINLQNAYHQISFAEREPCIETPN